MTVPSPAFDWQAAIRQFDRRVVVALLARGIGLERARELTQETWLRLMEGHRTGRLRDVKLPGLAITQAVFLAIDGNRRDHLRTGVGHAGPAYEPLDPGAAVDELLIERESVTRALDVVASCSDKARRIFELCYGHPELGHDEIATRVGLSVQRVRQTLCEVRKKVRQAIEDPK